MKLKTGKKSTGINTILWFSGAVWIYSTIRRMRKTRLRKFLQSSTKRKGALKYVPKGLEGSYLKWLDI